MEKKPSGNGVLYGLDVVAEAAHKQMLGNLEEGEIAKAHVWHDIAEEVRTAIVGQLLYAIEHGEMERSALIAKALRGWGVL